MPGVPPPSVFGRANLEIETIPRGRTFGRLYWSTYPDPGAENRRAGSAIRGAALLPTASAFSSLATP